jgi:hypothetical protein
MKSTCLAMLTLLLIGTGCVRSVHPFYTDAQLTYDQTVLGNWSDAEAKNGFVIAGDAELKQYSVAYTDKDGKVGHFIVHLAKLNRGQQPPQLLADIFPDDPKLDENDTYTAHLLPLHSFMLVSYNAGEIKLRLMDHDWLDKYLESHPNALKHERIDKDQLILTASTHELQKFVLDNLETKDAFGDSTELRRIGPTSRPGTP